MGFSQTCYLANVYLSFISSRRFDNSTFVITSFLHFDYLCGRKFGVALFGLADDSFCQLAESDARHGVVVDGGGLAFVSALADALHDGDLGQQGHLHFLCQTFYTFPAEEVVAILRQFGRGKPCHVFDQSEDGHVHLVVAVHVDALARVGQGDGLRGGDDDGAGDGEGLQEGEVDVARAGRRVKNKVVELVPSGVADELLEGI